MTWLLILAVVIPAAFLAAIPALVIAQQAKIAMDAARTIIDAHSKYRAALDENSRQS